MTAMIHYDLWYFSLGSYKPTGKNYSNVWFMDVYGIYNELVTGANHSTNVHITKGGA